MSVKPAVFQGIEIIDNNLDEPDLFLLKRTPLGSVIKARKTTFDRHPAHLRTNKNVMSAFERHLLQEVVQLSW